MTGAPGKLVLALLDEFAKDTRVSYSINQLALSTDKAYANIHATATALLKENILTKETVGRSHNCKLNLANDKTLLYLSLLQTRKKERFLREAPERHFLLKKISELAPTNDILLVWKRSNDLFIITTKHHELTSFFDTKIETITLKEFLTNTELQATIGQHTLLFGHALYAMLLGEQRSLKEVLQ